MEIDGNGSKEEITSETQFIALESSSQRCSNTNDLTDLMTQFLSLDKCLPRRHHLQIVNVPMPVSRRDESSNESVKSNDENKIDYDKKQTRTCNKLCYDLEWLAILRKTHHWTKTTRARFPDPDPQEIQISEEDVEAIRQRLVERGDTILSSSGNTSDVVGEASNIDPIMIPLNFSMSLQPHGAIGSEERVNAGRMVGNTQTDELLHLLDLKHVVTVPYVYKPVVSQGLQSIPSTNDILIRGREKDPNPTKNEDDNEIDLDSDDDTGEDNSNVNENDAKLGAPTRIPAINNGSTIINDNENLLLKGDQIVNIAETDSNEIDLDSD
eukprot:CAMPEP_0204645180 /NCGR_PEP_ID=MMETSP0718-20130828/1991_1 /ASSEMBLY_ACC=CAM_ASM_000674 /TAXON_ID=230516 /ORGANISM="Chaetoceros curvisetus" /LENGTH=324 /DNA_ID=CAMNT_0051666943 /DNA_START=1 /DNA_END=975 /DNA_ORIENTATION=+